jgi:hypothetical protein
MKQMQKVIDYVFHHVLPEPEMVDMHFCKSERTTFHYYMGRFLLIQQNVLKAAQHLQQAYLLCPQSFDTNNRYFT